MRARASTPLVVLAVLLVSVGCSRDHFELHEDRAGHLVRFDKESGELAVLEGDTLIAVSERATFPAGPADSDTLARPKNWPTLSWGEYGIGSEQLKTEWRDDTIRYLLRLLPSDSARGIGEGFSAVKRLTVVLYDSDDFIVRSLPIDPSELERRLDAGQKVAELDGNTSAPCTAEDYRRAAGWEVSWR